MKKKDMEIGLKIILKINDTEHILTINEVKSLSLILDSIIKREAPSIPWFPIIPSYSPDNITITCEEAIK